MTPVPPVALPPQVRAILYYVIFLVGLGLGATQLIYFGIGEGQPLWLTIAWNVYGFLASGFGVTAASNTKVPPSGPDVEP